MKRLFFALLFLVPLLAAAQEVYHIKFISSNVHYSVAVVLYDDDTGKMRVRYDAGEGVKLVEMDVTLEEGYLGFYIHGAKPVNVLSASPATYSADHFYVWADEDGEINCTNEDDGASESSCCIMEVTGANNTNVFLKEFNWSLD